jgi:curved DNA-binding protein CbpA
MQSYYDELGVSPSATTDEISAAFRQLAKKYHPDLNVGREHETRSAFVRVQTAFEILSDPGRRARYNEQYDEQFNSRSPWGSPPPPPVFEIQPLEEFQIHPSSLQPAITLPRIRRRLDPDLRKTMIFVGACIALAALILLIAS